MAEPLVFCADEDVIGTAFFVMAYVEGRVFWEPQMPASNAAERAQIYDAMNATLARLHSFDPAKIGLGDYGRGENYVARQVERWSKQYRASETAAHRGDGAPDRLAAGAFAAACTVAACARRLPARQHDYRARCAENLRRTRLGALDAWRSARRFLLSSDGVAHAHSQAGTGSLVGFDLAALGIPSLADYVDAYMARTGLDPRPYLPVYFAYNFFRLAAIMQGITGRVRDGTATSAYAAAKAELVRPLAAKGWEFARQAGP